jgi:peptidoglycan/xylan/chitin deacetylase (PgdA/CDA1 family)
MDSGRLGLRQLKTDYLRLFATRKIDIALQQAVISFTFDDVPRSAYQNGLPVLNSHGVKATFYVAGGLSGSSATANPEPGGNGQYLGPDDILDLHRRGHEIACHTYSHYRLDTGSAEGLAADARKNVMALEALHGAIRVEHFSYPFGQVSFRLKRLLSPAYRTMRSSRSGVNGAGTDLNLLLAMSIYDSTFDRKRLVATIEHAVCTGGWLVFYTHGVSTTPGKYDCTPEQLSWVLEQCSRHGAKLLPVAAACDRITLGLD